MISTVQTEIEIVISIEKNRPIGAFGHTIFDFAAKTRAGDINGLNRQVATIFHIRHFNTDDFAVSAIAGG